MEQKPASGFKWLNGIRLFCSTGLLLSAVVKAPVEVAAVKRHRVGPPCMGIEVHQYPPGQNFLHVIKTISRYVSELGYRDASAYVDVEVGSYSFLLTKDRRKKVTMGVMGWS